MFSANAFDEENRVVNAVGRDFLISFTPPPNWIGGGVPLIFTATWPKLLHAREEEMPTLVVV